MKTIMVFRDSGNNCTTEKCVEQWQFPGTVHKMSKLGWVLVESYGVKR